MLPRNSLSLVQQGHLGDLSDASNEVLRGEGSPVQAQITGIKKIRFSIQFESKPEILYS